MGTSSEDALTKCGDGMNELWAKIEDSLVEVVYTSNFIETVGSNYDVTEKICRRIFRGETIPDQIPPGSPEYIEARDALIDLNRPSNAEEISRSRQEIINHAQALNYAVDQIVLDSKPITEDFIREVHKKLCAGGVLGEDNGEPGVYRDWRIAARHGKGKKASQFIHPRAVPEYMNKLVSDIQADMAQAEADGSVDPFNMASSYCHRLVCIHPFGDGNGRMCRIILNVLLLKYAGHVSAFGGDAEEREQYLDIAKRGNMVFYDEDGVEDEEQKKGHQELARFILRKSKKALESMWT
ncbi:Fic-domain-containing protein [Whalleya microplaca]|nr:Fic-domain-containing protein [Whalleya microplaca]